MKVRAGMVQRGSHTLQRIALPTGVPREVVCFQRDLLLSEAEKCLVGCQDQVWSAAIGMAVELACIVEGAPFQYQATQNARTPTVMQSIYYTTPPPPTSRKYKAGC